MTIAENAKEAALGGGRLRLQLRGWSVWGGSAAKRRGRRRA